MLLPRVALQSNTDQSTITNPAIGLMVYNTTDNGSGNAMVFKNMFYYWNGVNWTNLTTLTEVKNELLPQVFFLAEGTGQNTADVNTSEVKVLYSPANIMLNTGNNISLDTNSNFKALNSGSYEVSGFINYNPQIFNLTSTTNLEFIIQVSTDNGTTWSQKAKTVGVWGAETTQNNRTNNIPPTVISLNANDLVQCVIRKTIGDKHGTGAMISAPTGLAYAKVLKIQKLD